MTRVTGAADVGDSELATGPVDQVDRLVEAAAVPCLFFGIGRLLDALFRVCSFKAAEDKSPKCRH